MKKLLLALCLATLGVACRASGANMSDTSGAKDCSSCTPEQMANCADCSEAKPDCQKACEGEAAAQVCPVTGKAMN